MIFLMTKISCQYPFIIRNIVCSSLSCCILNHWGFFPFFFFPQQILAVEILQHKFNIEKMMKVSELLQAYGESEDMGSLQVTIMKLLALKTSASTL